VAGRMGKPIDRVHPLQPQRQLPCPVGGSRRHQYETQLPGRRMTLSEKGFDQLDPRR